MANIFRKKDSYIDRVNRSTFDLSFVNNLTMKFGAITPVCLLPVSFGDSFQINARFNLQLLPTVFPIQTQLYVRLHFVYVRTRTLWEDWMTFFGGDETVTPPWMDVLADGNTPERKTQFNIPDDLQTGSLADYLGVPTTITGSYGLEEEFNPVFCTESGYSGNICPVVPLASTDKTQVLSFITSNTNNPLEQVFKCAYPSGDKEASQTFGIRLGQFPSSTVGKTGKIIVRSIRSLLLGISKSWGRPIVFLVTSSGKISSVVTDFTISDDFDSLSFWLDRSSTHADITSACLIFSPISISSYDDRVYLQYNSEGKKSRVTLRLTPHIFSSFASGEWTKPEAPNCPFYTSQNTLPPIPLSALPFRAYEAYYNAFGRDIRNNPFIVDGKPEYNKYVPSVKGGRDSYKYQLHYANWEPDAYTTALQSPQSGVAPLVGITSLGEATFRDAAGTEYHAQLETAEDGDTVTGFQVKSSGAPADVVRNLLGMATSGISISDFRNVNSLQRFLEIRVRQSPRYKNLVKGLFDVNLDYDELMMPEFLGGISDTIPVYKVTQTTPTEGNPLGSFHSALL